MKKYARVRDQHIAVFGESGSGKTVLVSSFFGVSQDPEGISEFWDLVAHDAGQGNRLLKNYVGLREDAQVPLQTRFGSITYDFDVKMKKGGRASARKRPFDVLRLVWHDYPGEWFEESPSSQAEANRRIDTFRSLLRSDVALVLVDGQKLRDYEGEESRYLKSLLGNLRQGLLRLGPDLVDDDKRIVEFPRIWIFALSKADLFPDWDVYTFRDLLIKEVNEEIDSLRKTIQDLVHAPEALALGEDFLLLSSAKFEVSAESPDPVEIDVSQRRGLDLILPIAAILPLERRVQWESMKEIPLKVLDSMADGAGVLAIALAGKHVGKLLGKLPKIGPFAEKFGQVALKYVAHMTQAKLREIHDQAIIDRDFLSATLSQFKIDLESGEENRTLIRSKN